MKVYSLYYKDTFVVAFPNREDTMDYGKKHYDEYAWDCNILEEYLSKSPLVFTPPSYTSFTPKQTIPCNPGVTLIPETNPGTYPDIYCGVKAND